MDAQSRFWSTIVIRFFFWRLSVRFCPIDRPCPVKGAGGGVCWPAGMDSRRKSRGAGVGGQILPSSCIEAPAGSNPIQGLCSFIARVGRCSICFVQREIGNELEGIWIAVATGESDEVENVRIEDYSHFPKALNKGEKDRLGVNGENKGEVGIVLPGNRTDRLSLLVWLCCAGTHALTWLVAKISSWPFLRWLYNNRADLQRRFAYCLLVRRNGRKEPGKSKSDVHLYLITIFGNIIFALAEAQEMANWPGQGDTLPLSSSSCEANLLQKCSTLTQMQQPLPNIQAVVAWIVLLNVLLLPLLHYLHVSELLETLFNGRPTTNPQLPLDVELQSGKDTQAGRQAPNPWLRLGKKGLRKRHPLVTDVERWNPKTADGGQIVDDVRRRFPRC
ncbi:hypothetical protein T05_6190 [Trichinella murrelli]|uniref:Uncharacterized protein n=1 Tax=Trichinella murrelli TaxID=144512 RepID=A0A0V0TZW6_9BILA|nr:hypothetical protein T05_6190 [Trichinella murrelli]